MCGDGLVDGGLEGADPAMQAASELLRGQLGEPALNEIEPGRVGRGEVDVEPWPLGEPGPDERRLVGRVVIVLVIHDDVHVEGGGHALVDAVEELAELARAIFADTPDLPFRTTRQCPAPALQSSGRLAHRPADLFDALRD